jgi:hypothetical protein
MSLQENSFKRGFEQNELPVVPILNMKGMKMKQL